MSTCPNKITPEMFSTPIQRMSFIEFSNLCNRNGFAVFEVGEDELKHDWNNAEDYEYEIVQPKLLKSSE